MHIMLGCLFLVVTAFAQKKYIWLRGLESENCLNSPEVYQQSLTASNGYVIDYKLNNTISGIASKIYHDSIKPVEHENEFVVIGFGMGGLIARSLQFYSPKIKAIITIGTPNAGSVWLKNTLSGKTYDYFSKAISMITQAVDYSLYSGVFNDVSIATLAAPIALPISIFKNTTVTGTLNELKLAWQTGMSVYALNHPCIRDMLPGSAFLTVPHINIYGAEDYWQVLRVVGSLSNNAKLNNQQRSDKGCDQKYITQMQAGLAFVSQIQHAHHLVYNVLSIASCTNPRIWLTRELVHNASLEWDVVHRYLDVGMHADFARSMGAVEYWLLDFCILTGIDMQKLTCKKTYFPYKLDNDGIFSRQDVVSGINTSNRTQHVKVMGVNNQEMGNHIKMKKLLEDIINNSKYGNEFGK